MFDIQLFIKSLKITWIRRFTNMDTKWKVFPEHYLRYEDINFLLVGTNYVKRLLSRTLTNPFWKDVFNAWISFNNCLQVNKSGNEIGLQPIWFNPKIKVAFHKTWYIKRIHFLQDIIATDGSFLSFDDIKLKFGVTGTFMDWEGLIRSIPKDWKQCLKNEPPDIILPMIPTSLSILLKHKKGCQLVYKILSRSKDSQYSKHQLIWERELGQIDDQTWKSIYKFIFISTMDPKLQEFQFKIIHRIIATNSLLYKIGVKLSDKCNFCKVQKDSILHKFVDCPNIQTFWGHAIDWLKQKGYQL